MKQPRRWIFSDGNVVPFCMHSMPPVHTLHLTITARHQQLDWFISELCQVYLKSVTQRIQLAVCCKLREVHEELFYFYQSLSGTNSG